MASTFSQLAGAPFANLLVIAALVCIAIAIFGWARETVAASSGFRTISGLTGVLLLFFVYGVYLPRAAHSNNAQSDPSAGTRSAATQQAGATRPTQPVQPSAQASPSSTKPTIVTAKSTTPLLPKDGRNGAPLQAQSPQPSTTQAATQNLFSGRWKNADPKAASILILRVEQRGGEITVRAWGTCGSRSQYCDWGTGHGVVREGEATVSWNQGPVLRRMRLLPEGDSLRVVLDSTSRGRPQHVEAHFAKSL